MAEITAALVKELRETTGVGMMDCKKALQETNGELEAAVDWLRAKGLSKAAKKADRVAAEGLVAVALRDEGPGNNTGGMTGAVIELNAETDFVSRNDLFQSAARKVATAALDIDGGDVQALNAATLPDGQSVSETITNLIATIVERDAPFYDPAMPEETVSRMNAFAQSVGQLSGPVPYEQVIAARCVKLWTE